MIFIIYFYYAIFPKINVLFNIINKNYIIFNNI